MLTDVTSVDEMFDGDLVRAYVAIHALDPVPEGEPLGVRRGSRQAVIEVYSWGRVVYARDRAQSMGVTVIQRGPRAQPLPDWVAVLVNDLEQAA